VFDGVAAADEAATERPTATTETRRHMNGSRLNACSYRPNLRR
jgi:hypothetical protein